MGADDQETTNQPVAEAGRGDRRTLLKRGAAIAGTAWVAPAVASSFLSPAAAASEPVVDPTTPPTTNTTSSSTTTTTTPERAPVAVDDTFEVPVTTDPNNAHVVTIDVLTNDDLGSPPATGVTWHTTEFSSGAGFGTHVLSIGTVRISGHQVGASRTMPYTISNEFGSSRGVVTATCVAQ